MKGEELQLHARIEDSHWWFKARREIIYSQLRRFVPAGCGSMVAEIGCGAGGNLKFLKDYYEVLGVDISPVAVAQTRERVACRALLGDFREVPADDWDRIDAVILADVLEHVDSDREFLGGIMTRVRPGAVAVITVPAHMYLWSHHDVALGHLRRYSKKRLRSLWSDTDVEELFFSPFNFLLFPLIALHRRLWPESGNGGGSDLSQPSPVINRLLYNIFIADRSLMRLSPLPFGISYMAVLKKKGPGRAAALKTGRKSGFTA
ncbi:MAG: class I SAM-dependent methyltransferase [Nitrospirae bacterium]|nr:class I SAM-dependent methyltransferase [Nitrospirota bacterium]